MSLAAVYTKSVFARTISVGECTGHQCWSRLPTLLCSGSKLCNTGSLKQLLAVWNTVRTDRHVLCGGMLTMHCPDWQFKFLLANKSVWFWNAWLLSTIKGGNSDIVPVKGVQKWEHWIEDYLSTPEQKKTTCVQTIPSDAVIHHLQQWGKDVSLEECAVIPLEWLVWMVNSGSVSYILGVSGIVDFSLSAFLMLQYF